MRQPTLRLLLLVLIGCSGGGGDGPTPPSAPPVPSQEPDRPDAGDATRDAATDSGAAIETGGERDTGVSETIEAQDFEEEIIDGTGVHGQGVELVDIDLDGNLDVLAAFSLTDTVRIYLNDGSARSWTMIEPIAPGTIVAMHATAVDVDGDRDLDLAVVGLFDREIGFESPGEVTWFENPGDPRRSWTRHEITGLTYWAPRVIRAGDLTGDGRPDLVVGSVEIAGRGNGVYWFRNTGAGFSEPIAVEATLGYVSSVVVHDLDGDRDLDILASSYSGGELVWYENQRTGVENSLAFTRHTIAALPGPFAVSLGQMDEDVELEAIANSASDGGRVAWFDAPADPRGAWNEHVITTGRGEGEVRFAAGDFAGDGSTDVAMTSFERGEVVVLVADAAGGFEPVQIAGGYAGANWIGSGDLDGDGRSDLITTTYDFPGGDRVSWWSLRR